MMEKSNGSQTISQSTEMNITDNLVIAEENHDRYPGQPYFLYIADHGAVGDKFNMDVGYNGIRFPYNASDRFDSLSEAHKVYHKFLNYVKDKILQASKVKTHEADKKPSYYQWK